LSEGERREAEQEGESEDFQETQPFGGGF
jgi:hypothetical protein